MAIVCIERAHAFPIPHVGELRGANNDEVSHEVWIATARWLSLHDLGAVCADRPPKEEQPVRCGLWTEIWGPFWRDRQSVPRWLPLRGRGGWRWRLNEEALAEAGFKKRRTWWWDEW